MRRIERENLAAETASELERLQAEADQLRQAGGFDSVKHWDGRRQAAHILSVLAALKHMAGKCEPCMYCVHSEAADIEHFWPKSPYPERMYVWENLLLACSICGKWKGAKFPLDDFGSPLLIDPTREDPWEFLDFDPVTGNLSSRYLLSTGDFSQRGQETVSILHLDRRAGLAASYLKTFKRLLDLFGSWTANQVPTDYRQQLSATDDHGLLGWFLRGAGSREPAVARFREQYGNVWAECERVFL
jgi:uncharacterized protein (TIGR02646 family)